jgi:hypothetical protein
LGALVEAVLRYGEFSKVIDLAWHVAVFDEIRDAGEEPRSWMKETINRRTSLDPLADAIEHANVIYTPNAARRVWQHRLDGGPFMIAEFVAHDSRLRLWELESCPQPRHRLAAV